MEPRELKTYTFMYRKNTKVNYDTSVSIEIGKDLNFVGEFGMVRNQDGSFELWLFDVKNFVTTAKVALLPSTQHMPPMDIESYIISRYMTCSFGTAGMHMVARVEDVDFVDGEVEALSVKAMIYQGPVGGYSPPKPTISFCGFRFALVCNENNRRVITLNVNIDDVIRIIPRQVKVGPNEIPVVVLVYSDRSQLLVPSHYLVKDAVTVFQTLLREYNIDGISIEAIVNNGEFHIGEVIGKQL